MIKFNKIKMRENNECKHYAMDAIKLNCSLINAGLISLSNEQSVLYKFERGWCDASYVGYTRRHLYQRIDEHKRSGSIFNHSQRQHQSRTITSNMFRILKKCSGKFDCLLYEMFLTSEHKLCLNIKSDSIKAKLFT